MESTKEVLEVIESRLDLAKSCLEKGWNATAFKMLQGISMEIEGSKHLFLEKYKGE